MDIKIINRAFIKMGENPISSVNELQQGSMVRVIYDDIRRSLLSMYTWRFAVKSANLAPLDEEPNTLHKYVFKLPDDYLTMLKKGDFYKFPDLRDLKMSSREEYEIFGDRIEASVNPLKIYYVGDVTETRLYPALFTEAMAAKIASELTVKVHQNASLKQMLESEFVNYIGLAMQNNDIIQDTQDLGDDTWVAVREGWGWH